LSSLTCDDNIWWR